VVEDVGEAEEGRQPIESGHQKVPVQTDGQDGRAEKKREASPAAGNNGNGNGEKVIVRRAPWRPQDETAARMTTPKKDGEDDDENVGKIYFILQKWDYSSANDK
jgi:hypothetical protein